MSTKVTTWVWDHSSVGGTDRLLLLALADEAGDDGASCNPGTRRLSRRVGVDRQTIGRATARLEEAGEVIVKRPERQGRGHFNRYVVLMGRDGDDVRGRLTGDWSAVLDEKGAQSETLPSVKGAQTPPKRREKARSDAPLPTDPLTDPKRTSGADAADADLVVDELCELLASRVEEHRGHRPKVTAGWRTEMDRLLRRGPAEWAEPEPVPAAKVRRMICFVFDHADPGPGGFCWADQIRSAPTLRRQWEKLRMWANRQMTNGAPDPSGGVEKDWMDRSG